MTLKTHISCITNRLEHRNSTNGTKENHLIYSNTNVIRKIPSIMLFGFYFTNYNVQEGKHLRNDVLSILYFMKTVYPY